LYIFGQQLRQDAFVEAVPDFMIEALNQQSISAARKIIVIAFFSGHAARSRNPRRMVRNFPIGR
jgi:hypothetical protein